MFGINTLKDEFEQYKQATKKRISQLEDSVWELKNPQKFKIGDSVDYVPTKGSESTFEFSGVIVDFKFKKSEFGDFPFHFNLIDKIYKVYSKDKKQTFSLNERNLNHVQNSRKR